MKVLSDPSPGRTAANSMANRSFLTGSLSGSSNFSLSAMLGMRMLSSPRCTAQFHVAHYAAAEPRQVR